MAMRYASQDLELASSFVLKWPGGPQQEFQFPPKITANSMSGDFKDEGPKIMGIYPSFTFAGPNERYYSIETSYIVDGDLWTVGSVRRAVQYFRAYFFNIKDLIATEKSGILAKFWNMGGDGETTFFMRNLNIKHSDRYVGEGSDVHPLRTDVSFDLVLWWNYLPLSQGSEPKNGLESDAGTQESWY
jgi:hypothetical protein